MNEPEESDMPGRRIALWTFHYAPEPTGIGPVARTLATGLRERGNDVSVVAAHPHYPRPAWGTARLPHRESRDDIPVLRLPLWIGRDTAIARYRQEITFVAGQFATMPAQPRPDVLVYVSPSFPGLLAPMAFGRARSVPWVLWLQDILPDGAASAGIVEADGRIVRESRRLELAAYRSAAKIAVISEAFVENLVGKGVPREKIELLYNPATRTRVLPPAPAESPRILSMGNIGHSQGLAALVAAYERSTAMERLDARLIVAGSGVAEGDLRAEIRSDRVEALGVVSDERLEEELARATIALVSQRHGGAEFNFPSKLMNFMAYGLPVMAVVDPASEVARVVRLADAGWIVDSSDPDAFPAKVAEVVADPGLVRERGAGAEAFARDNFSRTGFTSRFESVFGHLG